MEAQQRTALQEWKAHWPKVVAGTAGMSFYAMLTYHFGLFIQPLQAEFGWDRAQISLGLSIYTAGAMLLGPLVGWQIDRFGSRIIGIIGLIGTSLSLAALSFADGSLSQWYLLWFAIAVTALGVKSTIWGAAISSLFVTSRSLALSLVLSGSAIAQLLAPIGANWVIAHEGWRSAYRWLGLGWGGFALILVLLMFFDAHDQRKKAGPVTVPVASLGGLTVKEALRNPPILRMALGNVLMSTLGAGILVHMVPILTGTGIDRTSAAAMTGSAGVAGIVGKLLTGYLLDRHRGDFIPFTSFALGAIGYALLLNWFHSPIALTIGIMILGYTSGAGLQVTTYLCSRYGGMRNFGKIYATIGSMMMLGTTIGPWLAGAVYDHFHSYQIMLMVASPTVLICGFLFVGLGPYPHFPSQGPEGEAEAALAG